MSREKKYFKKIKKDYQTKNLSNPFFYKPKKKLSKRLVIIFLSASFLFLIFILWFFLAAPVWRISNIKVEGLTRLSDTDIKNKIWEQTIKSRYGLFKQDNIWLFDKAEAQKNILASYNFSSIQISKKLANTLIVKVGERPYSFIFQQGNDFFYASSEGDVIRESTVVESDKAKYLILENKNTTNLISEKNKINISDTYLSFIFELANQLSAKSELPVERFIIDQEFNTIKVKFKNGPIVYFNTRTDVKTQLDRLILVKREKIKDNFSKTNYIDLRYGDRIFIN
jgi:cell division septal protein FtsQ